MEPKSASQFEQGGVPSEFQPSLPTPESLRHSPEVSERPPSQQEHAAQPAPTPSAVGAVYAALPTPVQPQVTPVLDDDTPAVAADDDVIEKEWVDKAKKIIASTKDDPYRREREVGKLQADYLQKRYGKNLGRDE